MRLFRIIVARLCPLLLISLLSTIAQAQRTFDGASFRAAVEASDVSLLRLHAHWLETITAYLEAAPRDDYMPAGFGLTYRATPARFRVGDSRQLGVAQQVDVSGAFMVALYERKLMVPFGLQAQVVSPRSADLGGLQGSITQAMLFTGLTTPLFSLTGGSFISNRQGYDALGEFCARGTAGTVACPDARHAEQFAVLYTPWVGTAGAVVEKRGPLSFKTFRALLQPLKGVLIARLRQTLTPMLGLDYLAPWIDYYGERLDTQRDAPSMETIRTGPPRRALYELTFAARDIMRMGIDVGSTAVVAPKAAFRSAEIGWSRQWAGSGRVFGWPAISTGCVAQALSRGGRVAPAAEAYVDSWFGSAWQGFQVSLAYSYNTPGAMPGLPLPRAHVLSLQVSMGLPNILPPISRRLRSVVPEREGLQVTEYEAGR